MLLASSEGEENLIAREAVRTARISNLEMGVNTAASKERASGRRLSPNALLCLP
jgi:hypothetical protein